ncbi:MAG: ABC transporter substrate-binding protein, partial [Candidatus Eisenbacteria bacterium]
AQNVAFYRSDEVDGLLIQAQEEVDMAKRTALYEQAQALIHRDAPWVPLAHMTQLVAFTSRVHGYPMHPTGKVRFRTVWLEPGV